MYVAAGNGGRRAVRDTVGTMTLHVLIVEDDDDFVEELRETIEELPGDSNIRVAGSRDQTFEMLEDGPVTFLCRPKCSFRPLSFRRRQGFSSPKLSVAVADCRSH